MDTTYRLIVIGRDGMYTYGETAATPELAKLAPGNLIRRPHLHGLNSEPQLQRLGIERVEWTRKGDEIRVARKTLVEAETTPGEWEIGPERS